MRERVRMIFFVGLLAARRCGDAERLIDAQTSFLWLYSACDRPARLRIQSAQRRDVFLNALHVDWRQHFVNNRQRTR